jgi:hypothetical protein
MRQAREYLQQGLNQDWAACLQKYPETLDYYFGLVSVEVPGDDDPRVEQPVVMGGQGERKRRKKDRIKEGGFGGGMPPVQNNQPFAYGRYNSGPGMGGMPGMPVPGGGQGPFAYAPY